jgi:hypothetical protein
VTNNQGLGPDQVSCELRKAFGYGLETAWSRPRPQDLKRSPTGEDHVGQGACRP